ncbi:hypothetical protein YJ57_20125 [Salmonella enterica subsp. enterica]|nr:hypothetical protein [Salmonella enterica subsp. enterica]EDV1533667.1 hypothetical protein [Salmonella enterica subsp. enterica]
MVDIKIQFVDYSMVQIECNDSIRMEMREFFSFEVEGARYSNRYKYSGWNGKKCLMEYSGQLPIGLVKTVGVFAKQMSYSVWCDPRLMDKEDLEKEKFEEWCSNLEIYSGQNRIKHHWYQVEAAYQGLFHRRRMLVLPTSAGKSLIACTLSRWYLENYEGVYAPA